MEKNSKTAIGKKCGNDCTEVCASCLFSSERSGMDILGEKGEVRQGAEALKYIDLDLHRKGE